ncbi:hypothetical protein E0H72_21060 [Rhizobium leguminosarum bv. viciae]|uniref:hypothetical protein n=1 Tax=Rhizobium leguminosarum TaxID=384 RepID=UPI000646DDFB|nr:hypothetical protein [Rhizobium leguminosarum]TCA40293.1 hypothetical protein E0H72_21060 [Rhizobium leguminosarum bv. viciae]
MNSARLPPVDPDYIIEEDDPETLDSYARGLLAHLRNLRSGAKAEGYPKSVVKAAAVWLIRAYAAAGAAPCGEAAELVAEIVRPEPGANTLRITKVKAYWAAILFEAKYKPDPKGEQPSAATTYAVARHVLHLLNATGQDSAEGTIKAWRRKEHYRGNVALYRNNR